MNGKRLYREYAKYKGKDCHSFIRVERDYYNEVLHYKDSKGVEHTMEFQHQDMVIWIIKLLR